MTSKTKGQHLHANKRCIQRFGVALPARQLVAAIQTGKAEFVKRVSNRITIWRHTIAGQPAVMVYDSRRHTIVTVMTVPTWDTEPDDYILEWRSEK